MERKYKNIHHASKVSFSFPINKFPKKKFLEELAYIYIMINASNEEKSVLSLKKKKVQINM